MAAFLRKVWLFYRDGFKNQTWGRPLIWLVVLKFFILFAILTWGRPLIWLVVLKFFILFAILRVFFFRPVLGGKTDAEKSEAVGDNLTRNHRHTDTINLTEQPWTQSSGPGSSLP